MFRISPRATAGLMAGAIGLMLAIPSMAAADEFTAGGTGSSLPLLKLLVAEYRKSVPGFQLKVIEPPMGSGGALRALAAGKIDLAASGRTPGGDELAAVGSTVTELARTPFVLVTRDGVRPQGFSLVELADVYRGQITHWDNGLPLRVIMRSAFESDTKILRSFSPEMDRAVQGALERKGLAVAENDLEAIELIERIPGSLGPTTLGLVRTLGKSLNVLPLGGARPSAKAVGDGSYPWSKPLFVVTVRTPPPALRDFVAFMRSPRARELLRQHEYLPGKD